MMYPKPTHKRRKPKPVVKIHLQDKKECWVCGTTQNLESHHVYEGNGRRAKSEKYGLKVYLCHNHHNENIPGDAGVHHNAVLDGVLKRMAQRKFEEVYPRELFVKEFGKSYL
jgi:hypothetical protein